MARERNAEYNQQRRYVEREVKNINEVKPVDMQEWDCPKPGTAHQRQILKLRRKLDKQKEDQLRKRLEKQEIVVKVLASGEQTTVSLTDLNRYLLEQLFDSAKLDTFQSTNQTGSHS